MPTLLDVVDIKGPQLREQQLCESAISALCAHPENLTGEENVGVVREETRERRTEREQRDIAVHPKKSGCSKVFWY